MLFRKKLEENKPFLHQNCLEVRPASVLEGIELQIVASRRPLGGSLVKASWQVLGCNYYMGQY